MASAADRVYTERMALTRSPTPPAAVSTPPKDVPGDPGAGSTTAGDGIRLANLQSVVLTLTANSGQTLSGAGTLDCYIWHDATSLWARAPELDVSVNWPGPGGTTARQMRMWPAFRIPARLGGRLLWVTNGVTVSGGTDVLLRIDGFTGTYAS